MSLEKWRIEEIGIWIEKNFGRHKWTLSLGSTLTRRYYIDFKDISNITSMISLAILN